MHDDSSLFMNDSAEDVREPEQQMAAEIFSEQSRDPKKNRGYNKEAVPCENLDLERRVPEAKQAAPLGLAEADHAYQRRPADADRSKTQQSPRETVAFGPQQQMHGRKSSSRNQLNLKLKRPGTSTKQDRQATTDGKTTLSLSKPSIQSSRQAPLGSSAAGLGDTVDLNADLLLEAPGTDRTQPLPQASPLPEPLPQVPPAPTQRPEQPMLITLGQPSEPGGERAIEVQQIVSIVEERGHKAQLQTSRVQALMKPERASSLHSQQSKKGRTERRAPPSQLRFKRNYSNSGLRAPNRKGSERIGSGSRMQADLEQPRLGQDRRPLQSGRGGRSLRQVPVLSSASARCLHLEALQQDISLLDQQISQEYQELSSLSEVEMPNRPDPKSRVPPRPPAAHQAQREKQMMEMLLLQNQKMQELALSHWKFMTRTKIMGALASNAHHKRKERELDDMSMIYRKTRLLTSSFNKLKFFIKIMVPEERTMSAAFRQHQVTVLSNTLNELVLYARKRVAKRIRLQEAHEQLTKAKKTRLFNHFISYAASRAIKHAQNRQAIDKRRSFLLRDAFASLHLHTVRNFNLNLMFQKAALYHANNLLKKSFFLLLQNQDQAQHNRQLERLCTDFITNRSADHDIMLSTFIALHKFAIKQKKERKAALYNRECVMRRSFDQLVMGVKISRNYSNQKAISIELYNQRVLQMAYRGLRENVEEERKIVEEAKSAMGKLRLKRNLVGLKEVVNEKKVSSYMTNKAGIRYARYYLQHSFGKLMEDVWQDYPAQKISYCREVQGGRVELPFPNYLSVSKSHKYCEYFIEVNKILIKDLQAKALRALRINRLRMRQFQQNRLQRHKRFCFYALCRGVQGEVLIEKYIDRTTKVRNMLLMREVLRALRSSTKYRADLDDKFCLVLKARKDRIIHSTFKMWIIEYKEVKRQRELDDKADEFLRNRQINKHFTIWIKKLALKMKKRHLVANVLPLAQTRITARPYFSAWRDLQQKNIYLTQQLNQIERCQYTHILRRYYEILKQYTQYRQRKNHRSSVARQQYIYYLGKRVFKSLIMSTHQSLVKQSLNKNIMIDYQLRQKQKIISFLHDYAQHRRETRMNDHLLSLQVLKRHEVLLFRQWQNLCRKRQCLRYIETILDEARQRKSFHALIEYTTCQDLSCDVISERREEIHLKAQYFRELARYIHKRKELVRMGHFLCSNAKPQLEKRMMRLWRRRYAQRMNEHKMFYWTILQVKRCILQNYFKELRRNAIMKRLKKTSPLIFVENALRKTFKQLHLHSLTQQRHLTISTFIRKSRNRRLQHHALKTWRWRQAQAAKLRENFSCHLAMKRQRVFLELFKYSQRRRLQRQTTCLRQQAFNLFKQRHAIQKLQAHAQYKQTLRVKLQQASDFNENFMYHQAFLAWLRSYRVNRETMIKFKQVREARKLNVWRAYLGKWVELARRPIGKVRSVGLMSDVLERREMKKAISKLWQQVEKSRVQDQLAENFALICQERLATRALQALSSHVKLRMDQRERLLHVDLYSQERLKGIAIRSLKWYLQERRDKSDMKEIAGAQRASTLVRSSFFALRDRFQKRQLLMQATQEFHELRSRKEKARAILRLKQSLRAGRQAKMLTQKADIFRQFKAYERVFRGVFQYCVQKAASNISKQKAIDFREENLLRQQFYALKTYSVQKKLLCQKREMLFQVIQTIDQHNLIQNAYDSLFRHLVSSTNDVSNTQQQLRLQKSGRLFAILLQNAKKKKLMRQVKMRVLVRTQSLQRQDFFQKWRTLFIQEQVVKMCLQKRQYQQMQKVFMVLSRRCELKLILNRYQAECRQNLLQSCFQALGQKIVLKQIKEAQVQVAHSNVKCHLQSKALTALQRHTSRGLRMKQILYQRQRTQVKKGLRTWCDMAQRRQKQRGIMTHLVGKRDLVDKLMAFKTLQRTSFLNKMCHILSTSKQMTKAEEDENAREVFGHAFQSLKQNAVRRKTLRNKEHQIKSKCERMTLAIIMEALKQHSRSHLICLKLHKVMDPRLADCFSTLKNYAIKEAKLLEIEKEVANEKQFQTKNRVLYSWALLVDRRESLAKFIAKRQDRTVQQVFETLRQYWMKKVIQKQQEHRIIQYFSTKRPQCLHMFSKAFILLNHETVAQQQTVDFDLTKGDCSHAELGGGKLGLSHALPKPPSNAGIYAADQSDIEEMYSVNQGQSSASMMEKCSSQGVRLCPTVLAKYVFEKWRLNHDGIKEKNQSARLAMEQFTFMTLSKTFQAWRTRANIKANERRLLQHGREFHGEVLQKKAFEILVDYMQKRSSIKQLNAIGNELRSIRQTQDLHKMLVSWYDITIEAVNSERRFDSIIQTFRQMQHEKLLPLAFNSWKDVTAQNAEQRKLKKDLEDYSAQIYLKNLQKRAMLALKEQLSEEMQAAKVSKLFPIFQAWKFHVKENSLLKKYLSQAENREKKEQSILSEDVELFDGDDVDRSGQNLPQSLEDGGDSSQQDLVDSLYGKHQNLDSKLSMRHITYAGQINESGFQPLDSLAQKNPLESGYYADNAALKLSFMKKN